MLRLVLVALLVVGVSGSARAVCRFLEGCEEGAPHPAPSPAPQPVPSAEGDPEATVRAFYAALARGDGETASQLIVPESRDIEAFRADSLTRFYSRLPVPLRLESSERIGDNVVRVHYRYGRSDDNFCYGNAVVVTTTRGGQTLIERITANC